MFSFLKERFYKYGQSYLFVFCKQGLVQTNTTLRLPIITACLVTHAQEKHKSKTRYLFGFSMSWTLCYQDYTLISRRSATKIWFLSTQSRELTLNHSLNFWNFFLCVVKFLIDWNTHAADIGIPLTSSLFSKMFCLDSLSNSLNYRKRKKRTQQ